MSKRLRNPKPTINDICFISGREYASTHEVFYGTANSNISKRYKMQLKLHPEYHLQIYPSGIHRSEAFNKIVQHYFYFKFLEWYPDEDWKEIFHNTKNPVLFGDELEEYAAQLPQGITWERLQQIQYMTKGER